MSALRLAGWLLIVGGMSAIIGAMLPPYKQWTAPLEEGFRAIAGNPLGWWSIHAGFFVGTLLSALGLATLASELHRRPGGDWMLIAAVAYGFAATAWIINLAYRVSIWNWAARTFVATGVTPDSFDSLHRWADTMFAIFSFVGYASVAALGTAMLRAELGPPWLRWATLGWGLSAGLVVGYNVPFIMYMPFVALGWVLVRMP